MKVLVVHNFYRSSAPSGENDAVMAHIEELIAEGFTVQTFFVRSDWLVPLNKLGGFLAAVFYTTGLFSFFPLVWRIFRFKPDVVHIHNLFPLIGPTLLLWVPKFVKTYYTLHNYRNFCAGGVPIRLGKHCDLCFSGSKTNSLKFRCYRGSLLATLPIYCMNMLIEKFGLLNRCEKIIVLNRFKRDFLIERGILSEKIVIKGNHVNKIQLRNILSNDYVFVGRLTKEKGIECLLHFWRLSDTKNKLHVFGSGLLEDSLIKQFGSSNVIFHGFTEMSEIKKHLAKAKAIIVPSLCIEGYPMVVALAHSVGVPVIATDIGPLPEICGPNNLLLPYDDFVNRSGELVSFFNNLNTLVDDLCATQIGFEPIELMTYMKIYNAVPS